VTVLHGHAYRTDIHECPASVESDTARGVRRRDTTGNIEHEACRDL
jgi:hypothetical protein